MQLRDIVHAVAFSPDGKTALTGGGNLALLNERGEARLWETATRLPLGSPMEHKKPVMAVAFSPNGKTLLTGSLDSTACLWEAGTGKRSARTLQHENAVLAAVFSPDGMTVLTGSADKTAQLWEAATGKPLGRPFQHEDSVSAVAFSPDGKTVLTGSESNARLWQTATSKLLRAALQHQTPVKAVAFSPDGKIVLTSSDTVRLWETATGKLLGLPLQNKKTVMAIAFSPNGMTVVTGSENTARFWKAPRHIPEDPERILFWIQVITGAELDELGGLRVLDAQTWQQRCQRLQELGGPPDQAKPTRPEPNELKTPAPEGITKILEKRDPKTDQLIGLPRACKDSDLFASIWGLLGSWQGPLLAAPAFCRTDNLQLKANLPVPRLVFADQSLASPNGTKGIRYYLSIANAASFEVPAVLEIYADGKRIYGYLGILDLRRFSFFVEQQRAPPKEVYVIIKYPSTKKTVKSNSITLDPPNTPVVANEPPTTSDHILPTQTFALKIGNGFAGGLTFDGEHLWISVQGVRKQLLCYSVEGKALKQMDWTRGGNIAAGMAWDGSHLYVLAYGPGTIFRLSKSGAVVRTSELGQRGTFGCTHTGKFLVYGESQRVSSDSIVHTLDNEFKLQSSTHVPFYVRSLAWDGKLLWASGQQKIYRLGESLQILATYTTPVSVGNITWGNGSLWAVEENGDRLFRFVIPRVEK